MAGRYERTLRLGASSKRVWQAFTEPEQLSAWHGTAEVFEPVTGGRIRFADPGHDPVEGTVEEAVPYRRLRWRVSADGSVIDETFVANGAGTLVTIVHTGEADWPDHELEAITLGWDESLADLALFVDYGVALSRHMMQRSRIGATTRTTAAGVEVVAVSRGTFAAEVGLVPGDLLVQLGPAPIFDRSDLALLMRAHEAGVEIEASYVRDGRLIRRKGRLSQRE